MADASEEGGEKGMSGRGLGEKLGLSLLSADEVLYLVSITQMDGEFGGEFGDADSKKAAGLEVIKDVTQAWLLWKQQTRQNMPGWPLEKFTDMRRSEDTTALDYLDGIAEDSAEKEP